MKIKNSLLVITLVLLILPLSALAASDTTPPSRPRLAGPRLGSIVSTSTVTFDWVPSADNTGIARYDVYWKQNSASKWRSDSASSTYISEKLTDGNYDWKVRAVDRAGNKSDFSHVWTFKVDTVTTGSSASTVLVPQIDSRAAFSYQPPADSKSSGSSGSDSKGSTKKRGEVRGASDVASVLTGGQDEKQNADDQGGDKQASADTAKSKKQMAESASKDTTESKQSGQSAPEEVSVPEDLRESLSDKTGLKSLFSDDKPFWLAWWFWIIVGVVAVIVVFVVWHRRDLADGFGKKPQKQSLEKLYSSEENNVFDDLPVGEEVGSVSASELIDGKPQRQRLQRRKTPASVKEPAVAKDEDVEDIVDKMGEVAEAEE